MKKIATLLGIGAALVFAGIAQAVKPHHYRITTRQAQSAIRRWLEVPLADTSTKNCHRASRSTIECTLVESGYAPFSDGVNNSSDWSGVIYDVRARQIGRHRARVWCPNFTGSLTVRV